MNGAGGIERDDGTASSNGDDLLNLDSSILSGNPGPDGNFNPQDDYIEPTLTIHSRFSLFSDDPSELDNGVDVIFVDTPDPLPLADNRCAVRAATPDAFRRRRTMRRHEVVFDTNA